MSDPDYSKMSREELLQLAFSKMGRVDQILDHLEFRAKMIEDENRRNSIIPPGAEIKVLKWPKL